MSRVLPILFNTEMVRAILDGRKTVTRRVIKPQQLIGLGCDKCPNNQPEEYIKEKKMLFKPWCDMADNELISAVYKPPYQPGDILYVRETWCSGYDGEAYFYLADKNTEREQKRLIDYDSRRWRPSIHMPKKAARIWLKVTDVRVERLQEIDGAGILAEGVDNGKSNPAMGMRWENMQRIAFRELWNSTLKKSDLDCYGWDVNPWVWVIEFERCEKPKGE